MEVAWAGTSRSGGIIWRYYPKGKSCSALLTRIPLSDRDGLFSRVCLESGCRLVRVFPRVGCKLTHIDRMCHRWGEE